MRRGAELVAVAVAVLGVGLAGPSLVAPTPRAAAAEQVPDAQVDLLAGRLGGLDEQIAQLQTALGQADEALRTATAARDRAQSELSSRDQLQAQLVAQSRAYAVQRYMYGSTDSTDLLAFVAALNKGADDAVWGLAALEVATTAAKGQAEQVAKARAAIEEELVSLETDVMSLRTVRARRAQELDETTASRAEVALQFEAVVRDLGQATVNGMTTVAYQAYRRSADVLSLERPGCGLRWELLAAIGKTESNHGAGRLDAFGNSSVSIVGIAIGPDSDGGLLDGDATRDHAVGPMQFIPSTWKRWGADGNGDGRADPGNVVDAALSAGRYLCEAASDLTLTTEAGVIRAILAYNPNQAYLRVVGARFEALANDLARGWFSSAGLPDAPPPAAGLASNGGPDGRAAPGDVPLPAPPPTALHEVKVFTATGLAAPNPDPQPPEVPGACVGPSLVLGGRAGFLRCGSADTAAGTPPLDPCEPAPYDATLVGCLPDPTAPAVLILLAAPVAVQALGPPPPYRLLVLDGGDRCAPIPVSAELQPSPPTSPAPTPSPSPARHRATTTSAPATTPPTTGATARPKQAGAAATTSPTADTTTTTTADPSTTPTTEGPTTTAGTTGPGSTAPGTTGPDTTVATPPTVPAADGPTYACTSGATVIGPPDTSSATWSVLVRQDGLADRRLTVITAYS